MILLFRLLDSAPLLAFVLCGNVTNSVHIFSFFFGGFIVTKSEFAVSGFQKYKRGTSANKRKCYLRGGPSNLGFIFLCILGIVSSCVPYHKSSLGLLQFRIWAFLVHFSIPLSKPYRRKRYPYHAFSSPRPSLFSN